MPMLEMNTQQRQQQTLSPRLQHAVRLLQMSSLDFAALLRDKAGSNPFLEAEDGADLGAAGTSTASADAPSAADGGDIDARHDTAHALGDLDRVGAHDASPTSPSSAEPTAFDDSHPSGDSGADDRDLWLNAAGGPGAGGLRHAEGGDLSALDSMHDEPTLATHLQRQIDMLPLPPRDAALARAIALSLDDDGYLRTPLDTLLEELLPVLELEPAVTLEELRIALKHVQALEPAGVGAQNVAECLLLQLPALDCPRQRGLAQAIVGEHLSALAARDISGLARKLGATPPQVEAVCDRIRRLDPRPGWRFGAEQIAYIVPDVVARKQRSGQWQVQLNPAVVPKLRLNRVYADLFQRHRRRNGHMGGAAEAAEQHGDAQMAEHLRDAQWTLRNVEQRFSTILDVAQAIVRRQKHFLDYGPMAMKPLGLREIADEVGIHESTVSRVTNNKYLATPSGVFELKHFFSRAMVSANGSACSGTAIRSLIEDIIAAESPTAPLSDAEIGRQLAGQGLTVARRTVTKYRQMLKIDAVERRRRHN